jgi:TolB-like protein/Tfp pilus assembly protein PilF
LDVAGAFQVARIKIECCPDERFVKARRMNSKNFFSELKRRNVYKVAVAYAVVAWLLLQALSILLPAFDAPPWVLRVFIAAIAAGFPLALLFAWAFELTPEGIKRTDEVVPNQSIARKTGRKLVTIIAGLAAIALILLLFQVVRSRSGARSALPAAASASSSPSTPVISDKSIAVLPFENLSRDPDNAFFTDGVQDEILTDLAKIADLKVISRTSVMQYKTGQARHLRQIGQELGVSHVIEGSVQRATNKVRVNAQLIDTRTDAHLWAQTYDRDLSDVFAIQSEIAQAIADQLQARLSPNEKAAINKPPTTDVIAFDLYSRGKTLLLTAQFSAQTGAKFQQAADLLNQAVARDPAFFEAYRQLALAHESTYSLGLDHSAERLKMAEAALQAAARLRPEAGETHLARAEFLYYCRRDYDGALAELEVARRTLPNDSRLFELTGYIWRRRGQREEGLRNLQRAVELDPRNSDLLQQISLSYEGLRRYSEQAGVLGRALAIKPDDVDTRVSLASVPLAQRAETGPLHQVLAEIHAKDPEAIKSVAHEWFTCALAERDAAAANDALNALGTNNYGPDAVHFYRSFCDGLVARMTQDEAKARAAFTAARAEQEKRMRQEPDYGPNICVLGLIDAGLGRKEEALREGRRAMELVPVEKDAINGARMIEYFAIIAAWVGQKDLACEHLARAEQLDRSGTLSYGQLKLTPWWDPLRGDPRFEKIVASLAPKQ